MEDREDQLDKIVWSNSSAYDLDDIEKHYIDNGLSLEKASEKVLGIILATEETIFTKQWQVDEYDPSARRVIVKKEFRVLYKVVGNVIVISGVYPNRKYPDGILKR